MGEYTSSSAFNKKHPLLVWIEGESYDLTSWRDRHPGGGYILEKYHEKDATEIFGAFHGDDAKAMLKKMPSKPLSKVPDVDPEILAYRKLKAEIEALGLFEYSIGWNLYKGGTTVGLVLLAAMLTVMGHWMIGAVILGIGYTQLGWLGHDAAHHNITKNRRLNNFLAYFYGNFLSGFSVNWWKTRHNTHHAITNVLDADPDVDNLPLFVWDEADLDKVHDLAIAPSIIPYQQYYFLPFTFTLKIIWKLQSAVFVSETSAHNKSQKKALVYERATLIAHWIWLLYLSSYTGSVSSALSFIVLSELVGGAGIALIVFMNHYSLEQKSLAAGKTQNFIRLQVETTRNIDPNWFMNWLSGGLNLQIEHHLFPTLPRNNLLTIRPMVQKFCKENGFEYFTDDWFGCLNAVESKLARVAAVYRKQVGMQE